MPLACLQMGLQCHGLVWRQLCRCSATAVVCLVGVCLSAVLLYNMTYTLPCILGSQQQHTASLCSLLGSSLVVFDWCGVDCLLFAPHTHAPIAYALTVKCVWLHSI